MNPMDVLAPNDMGTVMKNTGVEALTTNTGHGVPEAYGQVSHIQNEKAASTNPALDTIRRAKARQYGKPMSEVGF